MKILWQPNTQHTLSSQMSKFMAMVNQELGLHLDNFRALHAWSVANYEQFWNIFVRFAGFIFQKPPSATVQRDSHFMETKFFPGATINFAENLMRFCTHAEYKNKTAIISVLENGVKEELNWQQLGNKTAALQQFLLDHGFAKHNTAAACLLNAAGAILAMLATTACGGVFSSASPDFGLTALLDRFSQTAPQILFVADGYYFKGKAIDISEKMLQLIQNLSSVRAVLIFDYLGQSSKLCDEINRQAPQVKAVVASELFRNHTQPIPDFTPITLEDPVYIMFSSGTTGKPKCIVQGPGVLLNQVKEHLLHNDMRPSDRLFYYTTCGWMMWNWQAASLFCGNSLLLYDGNPFYPDFGRLFELCREYQVTVFGTSARYLQTLQQQQYQLNDKQLQQQIRLVLSTGSPLLPETHIYAQEQLLPHSQICSISGGTDLNGCFLLGNPMEPIVAGELQGPALGMKIAVYDETGQETEGEGELVCETPFPSMPLRFLHDPENKKYHEAYFNVFPGVWRHGDFLKKTETGGYIISGRSDTTLNPGGVRIGTAEIYRAVETLPQVADSLAVGVPVRGDVAVVLFAVLTKQGKAQNSEDTIRLIKNTIRNLLSPRHVPAAIFFVPEIPLTVNGKKSEMAVKNILSGRPVTNRDALLNPGALDFFEQEKDNILKMISAR